MEEDDQCPTGRKFVCGIKLTFTLPDGITTVQEFGGSKSHDNHHHHSNSNNLHNDGNMVTDHNDDNNDHNTVTSQVSYTGRHDHGPLPPPRHPNGSYATLVDHVHDAKEFSNAFLTNVMKQETNSRQQHNKEKHHPDDDTTTMMETASKKHKSN
ncbi:hypothetical protein MHU86_25520 [Fragilaria crotonensis]|nr:hypothetical protein MHU86_25520 [Fragilaria crotonensis]